MGFQVSAEGRQVTVPNLPHERKDLQTEPQYGIDEYGLAETKKFLEKKLPGLEPSKLELHMRCYYQNTPDLNMLVGPHPADPDVAIACGFSGNGFQFAPVIGRRLAALALGVEPSSGSERDLCARMATRF